MCRRPVCRWDSLQDPVSIVLIGKYTVLSDAYLSVLKALQVRPLPLVRFAPLCLPGAPCLLHQHIAGCKSACISSDVGRQQDQMFQGMLSVCRQTG